MEKNTSKINDDNTYKLMPNSLLQKQNEFTSTVPQHYFLNSQNAEIPPYQQKPLEEIPIINSSQLYNINNINYWECFQGTPYYNSYEAYNVPQIKNFFSQKIPMKTLKDEEYIYVNSKQYYRILQRREKRKKLNALYNNNTKERTKKYLHESRHKHAMNRQRGKGGRFLSKIEKESAMKQEESNTNKNNCDKEIKN